MIRVIVFLLVALAIFLIYKGSGLLLKQHVQPVVKRMAYALSGLWLGIPLLIILAQHRWRLPEVDQDAWVAWVLLAVLPNVLFWLLIWVLRGSREYQ